MLSTIIKGTVHASRGLAHIWKQSRRWCHAFSKMRVEVSMNNSTRIDWPSLAVTESHLRSVAHSHPYLAPKYDYPPEDSFQDKIGRRRRSLCYMQSMYRLHWYHGTGKNLSELNALGVQDKTETPAVPSGENMRLSGCLSSVRFAPIKRIKIQRGLLICGKIGSPSSQDNWRCRSVEISSKWRTGLDRTD